MLVVGLAVGTALVPIASRSGASLTFDVTSHDVDVVPSISCGAPTERGRRAFRRDSGMPAPPSSIAPMKASRSSSAESRTS
jgi:hypothetical protein